MTITTFNIHEGVYAFEDTRLATQKHRHPALEIVIARRGSFQITDAGGTTRRARTALIRANAAHAVDGGETACEIWMFENEASVLEALRRNLPTLTITSSVTVLDFPTEVFSSELLERLTQANARPIDRDARVIASRQYILDKVTEGDLTRDRLARLVHLSPDRLSHLFKEELGISIQHYIAWTRLKYAIQITLEQACPLLEAAYQAGFYDAAHFSRSFAKMFGLNPSFAYNSSTVQIPPRK